MKPSEILSRAADLIRDTAGLAIVAPWYPSAGGQVRAGRDEEHFVATAATTTTARWIALMSPAVAEAQELILRNAAKDYDVQARIFTPDAMAQKLTERRFAGPLALARAVLGEKEENTDG